MRFWIFMMVMLLLIPVVMLLCGIFFSKDDTTEINYIFGYRTSRSMQNIDTWRFANNYFGGLWVKMSVPMAILSIIPMLFVINGTEDLIGGVGTVVMVLQLIPMLATIPITEKALKKHFDDDGNKKA